MVGKADRKEDIEFKINALATILDQEENRVENLYRNIRINYFSSQKLNSPRQAASFMYDRLRKTADSLGVDLINFLPKEKVLYPYFSKIPFFVEIEGNFSQIIRLFACLEEEEGLTVDALRIANRSGRDHDAGKLKCQFTFSGVEVENLCLEFLKKEGATQASLSPGHLGGLLLLDRWEEKKRAMKERIIKNPFSRSASVLGFVKTVNPDEPIDISQTISFSGVIGFPDRRVAIIERKIAREGDLVGGKQIIKIEKNRVILKEGNQLYLLRLTEGVLGH
jgi:hypothetical protein